LQGREMRRKTPVEFILLCDECDQITTGESVETYAQTRESPAEWESRGCCGEEFIDLEEEFNEATARELYETWYALENSSDYEKRIEADGYIKAIRDIVENK